MTNSVHSEALSLQGQWLLEDDRGDYSCMQALPGDIITGLQGADLIPDPYWGRNEYDLRWICERDWTLTREIELDRTDLVLVVGEVDTVATISLNGKIVLETANAHRVYRADVSGAAKIGTNRLEIRLHSVAREAQLRADDQPYRVPFQGENQPISNGNMLRKPQCDFGWDWNIALAPMGVYGTLHLEPKSEARIKRLAISQLHDADFVELNVVAHLEGTMVAGQEVTFEFEGRALSMPVPANGADKLVSASFRVSDLALWWPAGQGNQPLYDVVVRLGSQSEHRRIGLRKMELESQPDEVGRSFILKVNDRPVFCKGANWIPADALAGRISPEDVRAQLQSAVDANMNMIRIWGGGRYEPDWFHDMCDELGLMIWQDFMFSCNLYPCTEEFLAEVAEEVREVTANLHHHASTAIWCGDNELVGALSWFEESLKDRDRYLVAYDRLNREIELRMKETDPNAIWWPSSPTPGPLSFGDAWHDDTSGDMHFWSVWHEGRDFEHYRDVSPRFCSEFGFQSYPSMDVIRTFADPSDFNISAPVLESHQKNKGGNARIAETMFRYFRFPNNFENFVYLSQVQQGLAIHTAVSYWRSLKPHCMGTLIWQLNDTWPVCSWASLDYGGGWKLLHHMAKDFYQPVAVSLIPEGEQFVFKAVSDLPASTQVTLKAFAMAMDGSLRALGEVSETVEPASALELFRTTDVAEEEMVYFKWTTREGLTGADHFAPKPYKSYQLEAPKLDMSIAARETDWTIDLRSENPAFFVALEADVPGRFSDNAFLLLPDEPVTVTFIPENPQMPACFTVRDLHSATCI